jgi:hypothetical protein
MIFFDIKRIDAGCGKYPKSATLFGYFPSLAKFAIS